MIGWTREVKEIRKGKVRGTSGMKEEREREKKKTEKSERGYFLFATPNRLHNPISFQTPPINRRFFRFLCGRKIPLGMKCTLYRRFR